MASTYHPRARVYLDALLEDFNDGSGQTLINLDCIPRSVEIKRNDHRTADTFRIELDFRDFPLDPRLLRSVRVAILMGDVEMADFDLTNESRYQSFVGFVDVPETNLSESGETVTLDGRDYTCLFLDYQWPESMIDISQPLGDVISAIVKATPGAESIRIGYSRGGIDTLVLSDSIGRTKFAIQSGDDAWTIICDLCGRVGLVPVFELDTLLILSPADVGTSLEAFDAGEGFGPQEAVFAYGDNLKSLRYKRNFVEARSQQIEVRCWDEQSRRSSSARYPVNPIVRKKVGADGKVTTETGSYLPYYVAGPYSESELAAIAERVYNEAARQQVEVDIETDHMRDSNGANVVSQLGNGDRLTVTLGDRLVQSVAGMSEAEAVSFLSHGPDAMPEDVAVQLVAAFKQGERLARQFYIRDASHKWTRETGYTFSATAVNYVGGPPK